MDVYVLGVLIWGKHAHANNEPLLAQVQRGGNFLYSAQQFVPDVGIAQADIEQRRHPLLRDDDNMRLPPLFAAGIDVVFESKHIFVLIDDLVGFRAATVQTSAECMVGVRLFPNMLSLPGNQFRERRDHGMTLPQKWQTSCPVSKNGRASAVYLSDLLNGAQGVSWPKKAKAWDKLVRDAEVVYEDAHVIAFHDPEDSGHESPRVPGEIRITILPKESVATLIDLNVAHEQLNAKMLYAVQQVAYTLGLQNTGFELRSHILPPYQHRPGYALHMRAGKRPATKQSSASSA